MKPDHAASPTMQAYVYRRYGGPDVVELAEVPKPLPRANEVLVRIVATTVTSGDWRVRTLCVPKGLGLVARLAFGITRPRQPIMGSELAGTIEAIGKDVTRFRVGDEVFGFPGGAMGCHAQYRAMAEDGGLARKPANLSFEEAASLSFGGSTSLYFLRKAGLKAGDKVLVVGASGGRRGLRHRGRHGRSNVVRARQERPQGRRAAAGGGCGDTRDAGGLVGTVDWQPPCDRGPSRGAARRLAAAGRAGGIRCP